MKTQQEQTSWQFCMHKSLDVIQFNSLWLEVKHNRSYEGSYGSVKSWMAASSSKQNGYVSSRSVQVKPLNKQRMDVATPLEEWQVTFKGAGLPAASCACLIVSTLLRESLCLDGACPLFFALWYTNSCSDRTQLRSKWRRIVCLRYYDLINMAGR